MRVNVVKDRGDIQLAGIEVDLVTEGPNIKRITFRDPLGSFLEVAADYGSLHATVPAPPEVPAVPEDLSGL